MGLGFGVVGRERGSRSPFPFISPRSRLARLNNGYCFRNPPSIPASINIFPRKRSNSPSSSSTLTISYYLNHVIRDERMNNETLSPSLVNGRSIVFLSMTNDQTIRYDKDEFVRS